MKNERLIVALLVAVSSVLMTDVSFAVPPRIGNSSTQSTGGIDTKIGVKSNQGLVIKSQNVKLAEQLAPAVKNGVSLPRDLGSADPELNEGIRSYQNGQGRESPMTKQEVEADPDCNELPYGKSYLHDFNDRVAELCNLTPDNRAICYALAWLEHKGYIPQGTVLNVDGQHNAKFVCTNGEEYVFDKNGNLIASGINEGTFNISDPLKDPLGHAFNDVLAAVLALPQKSSMTKDEFYDFLEKYIAKNKITIKIPDFSKLIDFLKETVGCLSRINAMSHKPSKDDRAGYNKLMSRCWDELIAIGDEIERMNLSEEEKSRFKDKLDERYRESVMPYIDKIDTLKKQIEAKGYGRFKDIGPKYERFRLNAPQAVR